jgi:acetylornithine deacetylase/succinyl-diaminopimelate desuccinylase-like protein
MANSQETLSFVSALWQNEIISELEEYIKIPNQSPLFDKEWNVNGLMGQAVDLIVSWIVRQNVNGLKLEVVCEGGKTPIIFVEIDGTADISSTVMMYGHMDKQPPMTEFWDVGLGPWTPVIKDGKLYGRGGADDGYSAYAAICAIKALQTQAVQHSRYYASPLA